MCSDDMGISNLSCFMPFVLFLCFSFQIFLSLGSDDTISATQSLSGNQTIVSSGGNFELGFFKPGNSSNYYIGIWYQKVSTQTVVWVANRERGISDKYSSELKIINGNLVLFNESQNPIWSTDMDPSTTSNSIVAVLLDDGNLVLREGSNSRLPIWQSFDYPTNTFLPGGKIGYNKRTKTSQVLTSWKNSNDPATGLFSLELDPNGSQYIIRWNRSEQYWASGSWNGRIFSSVPEMRLNYIYNFSYVSNENESYFTYSLYNSSILSRCVMDISGQIKQLTWLDSSKEWNLFWAQPKARCKVYGSCGAFATCNPGSFPFCRCLPGFTPKLVNDYSGGCVRKSNSQCGTNSTANGEKERFLMISTGLPQHSQDVDVSSAAECESTCLNDCSCTAYSYYRIYCSIWRGDLSEEDGGSWGTIYIRLASSEFSSVKNNTGGAKNNKGVVIRALVGSVAGVLILLGLVFIVIWRRRRGLVGTAKVAKGSLVAFGYIDLKNFSEDNDIDVPFYDLESILAATDNFSHANKLGQGGFGPVYKGKFPGGQEIAVKRLSSHSTQGLEEFKNEVVLIAKLQHRNLVRLLGYCIMGDEKILLYEYMPNKSLDAFIFDGTLCMSLDWAKRFDIVLGIARGLLYLHQDSRLRVIHRDLKASNILLDGDMNPKILDFGLARIVGGRETKANTNRVVGTYGYMSPEYALDGLFSVKSDVFSFGVVLLEIVSGKKNTGFYQSQQALNLLGYAWRLWKEDKALDLIDQTLVDSCNRSEVLKCIIVGLVCVQEDTEDRPTMSSVVFMLGSEISTLPNPKQPAFVARKRINSTSSPLKLDIQSNNELTVSLAEGR